MSIQPPKKIWVTTEDVDFLVRAPIDPNTGVSTMAGAAVTAKAVNLETGAHVDGTGSVFAISPIPILRVVFPIGTFSAAGRWQFDVLSKPPGGNTIRVAGPILEIILGA